MANSKDEIMVIHDAWMRAERRRDIEAMMSLCSGDIRFCPPNLPTKQGKHEVREFLQRDGESIKEIKVSNIHIETSETLAYKTCTFLTELEEFPGSEIRRVQGSHFWVLRREESGWNIILITWSVW